MNLAASWRAHKWRWIAIGSALLLLSLSASGITNWPDELRGMRPASEQDEFFRYIAQELAEPSLCAKIPWTSRLPGGFFLAPSYERSACYDFIAGRTRNPWPCLRVRRLGAVTLLSEQTSMWSCLGDAWRGMNAGMAVSPATLAAYFSRMGYHADTLHLEGITPPVVTSPRGGDMPAETIYAAYMSFLEELNRNTDARHAEARRRFISRVRQLPAGT